MFLQFLNILNKIYSKITYFNKKILYLVILASHLTNDHNNKILSGLLNGTFDEDNVTEIGDLKVYKVSNDQHNGSFVKTYFQTYTYEFLIIIIIKFCLMKLFKQLIYSESFAKLLF